MTLNVYLFIIIRKLAGTHPPQVSHVQSCPSESDISASAGPTTALAKPSSAHPTAWPVVIQARDDKPLVKQRRYGPSNKAFFKTKKSKNHTKTKSLQTTT